MMVKYSTNLFLLVRIVSGWLGAEPDDRHGFADFMPLGELDDPYLVKDKLYVGVDFDVISVSNYC